MILIEVPWRSRIHYIGRFVYLTPLANFVLGLRKSIGSQRIFEGSGTLEGMDISSTHGINSGSSVIKAFDDSQFVLKFVLRKFCST